ncbi:UNVERIFIED_CONTAM: Cytosolic sulfotransferase 5 [Sesamum angustifolium]|uniref:Sulfotransferase n=1 Tax=Sesamum angustifolium TaxID=2727405 RepID=A0AAW2RL87_9LAMI
MERSRWYREYQTPQFPVVKDPGKARILPTHLPYQILGDILNSSDCKIVYVTRNPKDTLVSLWHFLRKSSVVEKDNPWEEELKENPRFHVRNLGEFLGCPFDKSENGEEKIDEIVKMCSFEILSSQQVSKSNEVPSVFPLPYSAFFRKGHGPQPIQLKPKAHFIMGFWFTETYLETTKRVVETLKPLPGDVILASFPKTGTTWLKAILHSIIHPSPQLQNHPLALNHPQELVPSLETNLYVEKGTELDGGNKTPEFLAVKDPQEARILATHIPYQILGDILNSSDCKVVYVTRNPKDTLVSLWHFLQKSSDVDKDPWEVEAAVDQFCRGVVPFGPYYDHVLAYRQESLNRPEKVYFLTYEELKEKSKNHVRKLGEFLGRPFDQSEKGRGED